MISRRITFAAIALVAIFAALTGTVIEQPDAIGRLDLAVNAFFSPYRTGAPVAAVLWITALGTGATLLAVMVVTTVLLWAHQRAGLIVPLWVCYLGTEAVTWGAKYLVDRHRPAFIAAASASSPSFPSAHAAGSLAVYGFIAYLAARETTAPHRWLVAAAAVVIVLTIGFSRIFLSVHYLSDVLGGYLVAGEWLLVGCAAAGQRMPE